MILPRVCIRKICEIFAADLNFFGAPSSQSKATNYCFFVSIYIPRAIGAGGAGEVGAGEGYDVTGKCAWSVRIRSTLYKKEREWLQRKGYVYALNKI
jgi:hypothetical protein